MHSAFIFGDFSPKKCPGRFFCSGRMSRGSLGKIFPKGEIIIHRENVRGIIWKGIRDGCPDPYARLQVSAV